MNAGARVNRRSQDIIDRKLFRVGLFAVEIELIPALVILAIAPDHLKVSAGRLVIEAVFGGVILTVFCGPGRAKERPMPVRI
jgi:hypothetical protein